MGKSFNELRQEWIDKTFGDRAEAQTQAWEGQRARHYHQTPYGAGYSEVQSAWGSAGKCSCEVEVLNKVTKDVIQLCLCCGKPLVVKWNEKMLVA